MDKIAENETDVCMVIVSNVYFFFFSEQLFVLS